nr:HNH endonuclease signature motif containing protein [Nakamurella aerolata]
MAARQRLINHLQAQQSADMALLAGNYPGLREFLSMEVAAALSISEQAVDGQLETAESVARRLPATWRAWDRGELDIAKVRYLDEHTQHLSVAELAAVEERVLPRASGQRMPAFRTAVRRAVLSINPESAEEHHQQAVEKRHIAVEGCAHGMALLTYYAPAQDVTMVWEVLTGVAAAARTPEDDRTLAQRRADALAALCSGVLDHGLPDGSRLSKRRCQRARLVVTMPVSVLTGSSDVCDLGRYGPITALQALQIADADANLQRLVCDPVSGVLVDASPVDKYRPPGWLAEQIEARDQTCMAPGCSQPAFRTEVDHCVPFSKGGKTDAANLGLLCKHHHRSKDGGGWFLERLPDGTFRWTSPLGRVHDRAPTRWWHQPEADAGATQFIDATPGDGNLRCPPAATGEPSVAAQAQAQAQDEDSRPSDSDDPPF